MSKKVKLGDFFVKETKRIKKLSVGKLIFFFVITAIVVVNFSVAKYKSAVTNIDTVTVALMAQDAYVEFENEIYGHPGDAPKVYAIRLSNKENEKICEVTQKYKMKIEREETQNLPIEIALYKDASCTQILSTDVNGYYEEEDYIFDAGVEQSKTVYLKIIWPEARKNASYAFEIDYFNLHIISTQVD